MNEINLLLPNGKNKTIKKQKTLYEIIKENKLNNDLPILLGKINNKYYELTSNINESGKLELISIDSSIGLTTYVKTLKFVLIKAVTKLFPEANIVIQHSINKGLFGEIYKNNPLNENETKIIKEEMQKIINDDIAIQKIKVSKNKAINIFEKYNMKDKVRLLKHIDPNEIYLYKLKDRYDYFYGKMAYSTGVLKKFDLVYYSNGFILRYPTEKDPYNIPTFIEYKKLTKIFRETERWENILGVGSVGALDDKVDSGEIIDIIRVSEALHEKKIANIADMISKRKNAKIVLISGPSSSGKTTFANRLGIQLRVNGYIPYAISLDDYFVNREFTPKDEFGNFNFETIDALDLKLFNENIKDIMSGKKVEIPSFDFKSGKRKWVDNYIQIPKNGILIVEGIHGLNPKLTKHIKASEKFKIYISALTQLNLDSHNRISTTDVRIIRRIVRDYLSRGYNPEDTLKMWPSIKRGEEKNIFVFQENADVMFNSTLVYELCILKKFALKELNKIKSDSHVYYEALRLRTFLSFFNEIDGSLVPNNSILREFIGNSCFYKY